jgi:branched-chain amino acid transport system permease protein
MLLYGLAMVIVMLYRPKGLWPAPEHGIAPSTLPDDRPAGSGVVAHG